MNNVQKSIQYHQTIVKQLEGMQMDEASIKMKLAEIDATIFETLIQEKINSMDETTYNEFKRLVESSPTREEISKIINMSEAEVQEKALQKLQEYI